MPSKFYGFCPKVAPVIYTSSPISISNIKARDQIRFEISCKKKKKKKKEKRKKRKENNNNNNNKKKKKTLKNCKGR